MTDSVREKLKQRSVELAKKTDKIRADRELIEVMPFQLASEQYALELKYIREIWPLTTVLPIPHTPPFLMGVTHVHGEICSIVDLKQFFSLPAGGITNLNKLVILEKDDMCFGILADDVLGSQYITREELSSTDEWNGIDSTHIIGITKERLIILDAEKILTDKRLIVDESINT